MDCGLLVASAVVACESAQDWASVVLGVEDEVDFDFGSFDLSAGAFYFA
jgi:hypothetical protein